MCGYPIGRQPFRAGQWSGYRGSGSINIYHKEVHNNYGGAMFPMMNYGNWGYYNPGLTSGEKWMLALGGIGTIGGAILGAIFGGNEEAKVQNDEKPVTQNDDAFQAQLDNLEEKIDTLNEKIETIEDENEKLRKQNPRMQSQADEIAARKRAAMEYTVGAEEVKTQLTTPFNVTAKKKENGKYEGHTGFNIVAGMYKAEDGHTLTNSEIKEIANKIFEGKALKVGEIQLPNKIKIGNINYTIKPQNEQNVKTVEYTLAKHEVYQSGAQQQGSYWIGTLNGEPLPNGTHYETEQDAIDAAKAVAEQQKAENEKEE